MNNVCVVIPAYNFPEMTKECIDYVIKNAGMDVDILVVDDGSTSPFNDSRVSVLRLDKNSGFTSAVNQGILWCKDNYKYIHILNNDTMPEPNFLKELYDVMEKNWKIALAGSVRVVTHEGEPSLENYGADLLRGYQVMSRQDLPLEEISTNWIPFCSVMLSHKAIRYLGLLDPFMVNHCSDNDWCLRARINGWNVVLVTKSKVKHIHEVTTRHCKLDPNTDQQRMLQKLTGALYAQIMTQLPIDCESNTWGRIKFETYRPMSEVREEQKEVSCEKA